MSKCETSALSETPTDNPVESGIVCFEKTSKEVSKDKIIVFTDKKGEKIEMSTESLLLALKLLGPPVTECNPI